MTQEYVHGYGIEAKQRLLDQSRTLRELLLHDTRYAPGEHVLEAGCGIGAQTEWLAANHLGTNFTSIDIDRSSLEEAKALCQSAENVTFEHGDLNHLAYEDNQFDHVFVCFVLEHLRTPLNALVEANRVLKPGGTITVIEGDHGSVVMHPKSQAAQAAIEAQMALQVRELGDATFGRRLYPTLSSTGFESVAVSPRVVYADATRPDLVEHFVEKTLTQMIEGIREPAIRANIISERKFDLGIEALRRAQEADGVFTYTFFKAVGVKPPLLRPNRT